MDKLEGRSFIRWRDVLILFSIVALALLAMWYMRTAAVKQGNIAIVTLEGREIMRFNLAEYENKREYISLWESHYLPVNFELADGGIRFVDVDCPDHLCEAMGVCRTEYDVAVCLPNATMISVYAPDDLPQIIQSSK